MIRDQSQMTAAQIGAPPDIILHRAAGRPPEQYGMLGCPLCRRPIPLPDNCADGSTPMAECIPCDLYFDASDGDACIRLPVLA